MEHQNICLMETETRNTFNFTYLMEPGEMELPNIYLMKTGKMEHHNIHLMETRTMEHPNIYI